MCRNIKVLFNFDPPATKEEIRNASLQFVRKLSGTNKPAKINEEAFDMAVNDIAESIENLLQSLSTNVHPKNRDIEAALARARFKKRFAN